jgi:hypothetical protein
MRTSSAKAKGRRLCARVKELLYKYAPDLRPGDIEITSSGCTGEDLKLSPAARQVYPFVVEGKCQESLNIWSALKQAEGHLKNHDTDYGFVVPTLFFSRNHADLYVAMKAEDFIRLVR